MSIDTGFPERCIRALERALEQLRNNTPDAIDYEVYRAACVKEFEIILEQSGKLLRKCLADYFASNRQADAYNFRDIFRHVAKHDLLDAAACERWLQYRDNRNSAAHDYGIHFAEKTLALLPQFIIDARALAAAIRAAKND